MVPDSVFVFGYWFVGMLITLFIITAIYGMHHACMHSFVIMLNGNGVVGFSFLEFEIMHFFLF